MDAVVIYVCCKIKKVGEKMILDEYKNNIKKNKNFKVGLYTQKDKTYMSLEFDREMEDNKIMHYIIPKISLDSVQPIIDRKRNSFPKYVVQFNAEFDNDDCMQITELVPIKAMTLEEIEVN